MKHHIKHKLNTRLMKNQIRATHNFLSPSINRVIDVLPVEKTTKEDLKQANKYLSKGAEKAIDLYDQYMQPTYREENKQNTANMGKKLIYG